MNQLLSNDDVVCDVSARDKAALIGRYKGWEDAFKFAHQNFCHDLANYVAKPNRTKVGNIFWLSYFRNKH